MKPLTIIIPAYNEADGLSSLLPSLITSCQSIPNLNVLVVNDGSTDDTFRVLQQFKNEPNFGFINHKRNKGYGAAIKTGIRKCTTPYLATMDADGQHELTDITKLYENLVENDADLIIGNRGKHAEKIYRRLGKWGIRKIAKILLPIHIQDLNSGMKVCRADLAKSYIRLCPDSFAFSDTFALVFIRQRDVVLEKEINVKPRSTGQSKISTQTAFITLKEILNIVILFNPMKIFFPITIIFILFGIIWTVPFLLRGTGVSVASTLMIISGLIFFLLGLIAEQLSLIRRNMIDRESQDTR